MVIGDKGERIKRIGTETRVELEKLLDAKVFIELWVTVRSGWADDEAYLLMGRLMAVLLNSNCLAVYYPQDGEIEIVDQDTSTKLVTRR